MKIKSKKISITFIVLISIITFIVFTCMLFYFGNSQWSKYIYMAQDSDMFGLFPCRELIKNPNETNYSGVWREWDEDGHKTYEGLFEKGLKQGKHISYFYYYKKNQKQSEEEFLNGLSHGKSVSYRLNGKISSEGEYIKGELQTISCFHKNGQKKIVLVFKNRKRDGICKEWDINGNLLHEKIYKNGEEVLVFKNIKLNKYDLPSNVLLDNNFFKKLFKGPEEITDKNQVVKLLGVPPWQYLEKYGCFRFKYFQTTKGIKRELTVYFSSEGKINKTSLVFTDLKGNIQSTRTSQVIHHHH